MLLVLHTGCAPALSPAIDVAGPTSPSFAVEETTIAQIHSARLDGRLTARSLVDAYLARIEAYDKRGPLHGVPVAVKDLCYQSPAESLEEIRTGIGAC